MLDISQNRIPASYVEDGKFSSLEKTNSPKIVSSFSHILYVLFGIGIIVLFLPWTQNINSYGSVISLLPEDRPQTVNTIIAGRVEKWYVPEGAFVKKGDTLLQLSEIKVEYFNPDLIANVQQQVGAKQSSLTAINDKVAALQRQIEALKDGQRLSVEKAVNKLNQAAFKLVSDSNEMVAANLDLSIAKVQFDRQKNLYDKGLKSLTELEQRRLKLQETTAKAISYENKFLVSKSELINARIELNSLKAEYADKISKAESDYNTTLAYGFDTEGSISKMQNDLANYKIRNNNYYITAPRTGYAVKALVAGIGETIKEGEAVYTIVDNNSVNAVELFVRPMDVPLLSKGRKVRLQFDGWPALVFSGWPGSSFGTFGGTVEVIDRVTSKGGKFRILVVPDDDQHQHPWPEQLRQGGGVYGWALLNDVPIWYELWRQINGFPPDWMGTDETPKSDNK